MQHVSSRSASQIFIERNCRQNITEMLRVDQFQTNEIQRRDNIANVEPIDLTVEQEARYQVVSCHVVSILARVVNVILGVGQRCAENGFEKGC